MKCDEHQRQIDRWLDDQLLVNERRQIEQHLEGCDNCRLFFAQRAAEDARLRAAFGSARESAVRVADKVVADMPAITPTVTSRRGGKSSLLMAAAAGFLLALILFPPWKRTTPPAVVRPPAAVAHVSLVVGSLECADDVGDAEPKWQPVVVADSIKGQSRVRTGANDLCEIRSDACDIIRLNCDTEVAIGAKTHLQLNRGQIWCQTGVVDKSLRITTPNHELQVTGTCDVSKTDQHLDILVCAGTTTLQGKQGPTTLQAGERARVVDGMIDATPSIVDPLLATRWIHPLLALRATDDPESLQRIDQLWSALGRAKVGLLYEEELRVLGDRCSKPLIAYLKSPTSRQDPTRRVQAAKILSDVAEYRWAADFVDLLEDENEDVRLHVARGLERLTGQTLAWHPPTGRTPNSVSMR